MRAPWLARVAWFAALWCGGVAALALVAGLLRVLMHWAGLR